MSSATMANSNKRRKLNSNNVTQNPQINSIIVRDFGGTMFVGWINQFFEKEQMWEVIYEDGDKEDLNRKELLRYLQPDINQHFGEFYKVTFPANEALGVVMAPKPNEEKGQNGVNNKETTSDGIQRSIVVKTKSLCIGRGLLTKFDEVSIVAMKPETRNKSFKEIVGLLRARSQDEPLTVIFKRHKENILLRKAVYKTCFALFKEVCLLWNKIPASSANNIRVHVQKILHEENTAAKNGDQDINNNNNNNSNNIEDKEFGDRFFEAIQANDLKALFFHLAPTTKTDRSDIEKTVNRFSRLKKHLNKIMTNLNIQSNGVNSNHHEKSINNNGNVNINNINNNSSNNNTSATTTAADTARNKNGPISIAAAAVTTATRTNSNRQSGKTTFQANTVDDTKRKFLQIRRDNIQTPSTQMHENNMEPAHTQYLCVGNIPVCMPQVGLYVWAFMKDPNHIRNLGLPTNTPHVTFGYYRALIIGIQQNGNAIRLHWISLGQNKRDENWYDAKKLRLWRPAPSPIALYTFLRTEGRHMIQLSAGEKRQMIGHFNSMRGALQQRYKLARKAAIKAFVHAPRLPISDRSYDFCITFPSETLGIGIDMDHSDGGIMVTSVRGVPGNPTELNLAMQNIHVGDRIVAVRKRAMPQNFDFTTINTNLEDIILWIKSAGRPLQIFFLRKEHHPYIEFKNILQKRKQLMQAQAVQQQQQHQQQQQLLAWRQREQQKKLAAVHKRQQLALRQQHQKRLEATQNQASNNAVNTDLVIKATKDQLNEAYKEIEKLHATGKDLHNKLSEAYKVIVTTKERMNRLEETLKYLSSTDEKRILKGISERLPRIDLVLGKMKKEELDKFHDTFIVPYNKVLTQREQLMAQIQKTRHISDDGANSAAATTAVAETTETTKTTTIAAAAEEKNNVDTDTENVA